MELRRSLGPLTEPVFARYFTAVVISTAGSYASVIALTFAVLAASGPTALGFIFLAREIPVIAFVLVGGVFADRLPRRYVLAGSSFVSGLSQLLAAGILIHGSANILALAACAVVNGSATAFERPATAGVLPEIVSASWVQQANALLGLNRQVVGIAGAALGSWLINSVGAGYALAFDSLTFMVAGALLLTLAKDLPRPDRKTSPLADFREGWHEVRSRTWVWAMILSFGVFQLAYFPALMVLGSDIARKDLGGASAWATIITGELVGGIIGSLIAFKIRFVRPLIVTNLFCIPTIFQLLGFALSWPLAILVLCTVFASIGFAIGGTLWISTVQKLIPGESLSRVFSFDWLGSLALNPLGYALVGPLSVVLGERSTMGYSAVLLSLAIFLPSILPAVRAVRIPPVDVLQGRGA